MITLGIIGIVAAMTIPTLVTKYQAKIYETKLKKAYSIIQNANTYLIAKGISPYYDYDKNTKGADILQKQTQNMAELISGAKLCDSTKNNNCKRNYTNLAGNGTLHIGPISNKTSILLPDNMIMWIGFYHWIYIDLNGQNKPNKAGYDLHTFKITENNGILPVANPAHDTRPCTLSDLNSTDPYLGYGCTEYALLNKNPDGAGNYWTDFLKQK